MRAESFGITDLYPAAPRRAWGAREMVTPRCCEACGGEPPDDLATYRIERVDETVVELCPRHLAMLMIRLLACEQVMAEQVLGWVDQMRGSAG